MTGECHHSAASEFDIEQTAGQHGGYLFHHLDVPIDTGLEGQQVVAVDEYRIVL